MRDGSWTPSLYYGGFEDGVLTMAPYGELVSPEEPSSRQRRLRSLNHQRSLGRLAGPVADRQGDTVIRRARRLTTSASSAATGSSRGWSIRVTGRPLLGAPMEAARTSSEISSSG